MTPGALAALHARAFTDAPRPWSAAEFAALLAAASTLLVARGEGFALGRVAGPEAELLTLAVDPGARRRGLGRALVGAFEATAAARGAEEVLLEVAVTNARGAGALRRPRLCRGRAAAGLLPAGRGAAGRRPGAAPRARGRPGRPKNRLTDSGG